MGSSHHHGPVGNDGRGRYAAPPVRQPTAGKAEQPRDGPNDHSTQNHFIGGRVLPSTGVAPPSTSSTMTTRVAAVATIQKTVATVVVDPLRHGWHGVGSVNVGGTGVSVYVDASLMLPACEVPSSYPRQATCLRHRKLKSLLPPSPGMATEPQRKGTVPARGNQRQSKESFWTATVRKLRRGADGRSSHLVVRRSGRAVLAVLCALSASQSVPADDGLLPIVKFFYYDAKSIRWVVSAEPEVLQTHLQQNADSKTLYESLVSIVGGDAEPKGVRRR